MNKTKVFFLILYTHSILAFSQKEVEGCTEAREFFMSFKGDCKTSISSHNCIHLDVTESYDFQGKELLFKWEMGDGNYYEGMEVNHCYEQPGNYLAVLSLFDPITKITVANEHEVKITINPEFELSIHPTEAIQVGDSLLHDYLIDFPETDYTLDKMYWYFDDGTFSCKNSPMHVYTSSGVFQTRLLTRVVSETSQEWLCAIDSVHVKILEGDKKLLTGVFDSIQIATRFLADEVHYKVLEKGELSLAEISDLYLLTPGKSYKLLVYRGGIIFDFPEIEIETGNDNRAILDSINSLIEQVVYLEPLKFESIFFEPDQQVLSKKNKRKINGNILLLEKFTNLKILIGVYTTSTGSLDIGTNLSVGRAQLIKDYMVEQGIEMDRLFTADPNSYRSLINSCVTGVNCDYVDVTLDRRADFKILTQ